MAGCPFHSDDADGADADGADADGADADSPTHAWTRERGIDRRAFVKSAVAIGGVSALSAALGVEADAADGDSNPDDMPYPQGDPSRRPASQHRWSPVGRTDASGNPVPPAHQVVLLADYEGSDPDADAATVEAALRQLERAFEYDQRNGLLFVVGYAPAYFKRHRRGPPRGVDITEPRSVSPHATPALNREDLFVQLASDRASIVLAAEAALLGNVDAVNGVAVDASLDDFCVVAERRSVFAGAGLPAEHIDDDRVDAEAPLSMGFSSAFEDSIPDEDAVTIDEGPWVDGTVAQVSKLALDLPGWYDVERSDRVERMFAPEYTVEDVGEFGEGLGAGSGRGDGEGWSEAVTDRIEDDARERGVVGHSQKVTRARDDDFEPTLLRRDGNITTEGGGGGLSFVGLVPGISEWFAVAEAMYDTTFDRMLRQYDHDAGDANAARPAGGQSASDDHGRQNARDDGNAGGAHHPRNGIASHVDPLARGHYLVPPRSLRALPPSRP